jgi:hypothetical protein
LTWIVREDVCSGVNAEVCDFVNQLTMTGAQDVNGVTKLEVGQSDRSKKQAGPLAIVRSKKKGLFSRVAVFCLLASCFLLLTSDLRG